MVIIPSTRLYGAVPLAILCISAVCVSAKEHDKGYKWAKDVWKEKDYDCSHDDLEDFWDDKVQKDVYKWCEDEYSGDKKEDDCKEGAEDFVDEKEEECASQFGYDEAEDLWDDDDYKCDDIDDFEDEMKDEVYDECKDEYEDYSSKVIDACEDGAKEFFEKMEKKCDRNGNDDDKDDAYRYGYKKSKNLWYDGNYRCTKDDLKDFWERVDDDVFDDCSERYSGKERKYCEKGAEDYIGCRDDRM